MKKVVNGDCLEVEHSLSSMKTVFALFCFKASNFLLSSGCSVMFLAVIFNGYHESCPGIALHPLANIVWEMWREGGATSNCPGVCLLSTGNLAYLTPPE